MKKTIFEHCTELNAIHRSIYRTLSALESLAPQIVPTCLCHASTYQTILFDPTPYESHNEECVRQLAKNLSVLVDTYNKKGLETP